MDLRIDEIGQVEHQWVKHSYNINVFTELAKNLRRAVDKNQHKLFRTLVKNEWHRSTGVIILPLMMIA